MEELKTRTDLRGVTATVGAVGATINNIRSSGGSSITYPDGPDRLYDGACPDVDAPP